MLKAGLLIFGWLLAVAVVGVCALFLGGSEHPALSDLSDLVTSDRWQGALFLAGLLLVVQIALLLGAPQLTWPRPRRRRSIASSMIAGSLLCAAVTVGLVFSALSVLTLIGIEWQPRDPDAWFGLDGLAILALWAIWLFVFVFIWAGEWLVMFRRMYRLLIAGTVLELLVTIPIHVHIRKRTHCYCGEGTFFGLVLGISAAACAFGPGVVLLFIA